MTTFLLLSSTFVESGMLKEAETIVIGEEKFIETLKTYQFEDIEQLMRILVNKNKELKIKEIEILFYEYQDREIIIYFSML